VAGGARSSIAFYALALYPADPFSQPMEAVMAKRIKPEDQPSFRGDL